MVRVTKYALIAALSALLGLGGYAWWLDRQLASERHDNAVMRGLLASCTARAINLTEDKESDATVTDPGGFDVPDRWLLPDEDTAPR